MFSATVACVVKYTHTKEDALSTITATQTKLPTGTWNVDPVHSEVAFSATDIRRSGDEVTVNGELTIKGITKPVELTGTVADPVEDYTGNDRIGLTLDTTNDRTQFGLNWNLPLPNGKPALANDVKLTAELYLVKA